jgi:hypothetical protein
MFNNSSKNADAEKRLNPFSDVDPHYVDALLSNELHQMDFRTRNEIQEEIHGVRTLAKKETPEMIESSLLALEQEVRDIVDKEAYDESQEYPDTYVNTHAFRLKFLRAEVFNAKAAATRMVTFLEMMKDYYGPKGLVHPPRMNDLGKAEMELLKSGGHQLLPSCDRSGRRIAIWIGSHGKGFSVYSRVCSF